MPQTITRDLLQRKNWGFDGLLWASGYLDRRFVAVQIRLN
jgi:hypothetical protein